MGDSFAFPVEFPSSWKPTCPEEWALALGITSAWPVTLRQESERAYYLFA